MVQEPLIPVETDHSLSMLADRVTERPVKPVRLVVAVVVPETGRVWASVKVGTDRVPLDQELKNTTPARPVGTAGKEEEVFCSQGKAGSGMKSAVGSEVMPGPVRNTPTLSLRPTCQFPEELTVFVKLVSPVKLTCAAVRVPSEASKPGTVNEASNTVGPSTFAAAHRGASVTGATPPIEGEAAATPPNDEKQGDTERPDGEECVSRGGHRPDSVMWWMKLHSL